VICWFDDRTSGTRIALDQLVERIGIDSPQKVEPAIRRICQAQEKGFWVALVIEYELAHWLEPALSGCDHPHHGERLTAWVFRNARTQAIPQGTRPDPCTARISHARSTLPKPDYIAMIDEIRELIANGEVYQINATFALEITAQGQPRDLYEQLAGQSTARYCAYIDDTTANRKILSFSPELFVRRQGNLLTTKPMKGTAPRFPQDREKDQDMARQLTSSIKDRAENLMIVDLLRNDLGRIARPGTVKVDPLFELEAYPTVWTMTSTISAELEESCSFLDILRALFPCGSVTGAPKIAAMKHIRRLETRPRGVYCGSIGWLAPGGDFSLNVAIRTLVLDNQSKGIYNVGGGIVHDSDPEREWQECFWKSRILGVDCET